MKKLLSLPSLFVMVLFLCTSCTFHTYHFGVPNRAATVPDDFGETEAAIARAERSEGARYCPEKIARAKELAHDGAETYWLCNNTESSRLLAEARKLAEEAEGCGPKGAAPKKEELCMGLNIEFATDSAVIEPAYFREVERVASFMKTYPDVKGTIEGHTDNVGSAGYNLELSHRRAESIVNMLLEKYGIDQSRLKARGYGLTRPVADNNTIEGRQKNRRIVANFGCVTVGE